MIKLELRIKSTTDQIDELTDQRIKSTDQIKSMIKLMINELKLTRIK